MELAKAADISEKRRAAAKTKHEKNRNANAVQMHTQSQPQSPSQLEPDPPLSEKALVYSNEKNYSQTNFDARDLRKLSDALKKVELRLLASVGSGNSPTNKEVFEWACEEAGISVERGLEVQERGRRWPQTQAMRASA